MKRFSYTRDGQVFGPTDLGGLRQLAKSLHLRPECVVRQSGEVVGIPAGKVEGLFVGGIEEGPADETPREKVIVDYAYLAAQRRLIVTVLLGGGAFLTALAVATLVLSSTF